MWIQTATPIQFPLGTDAVDILVRTYMISGIVRLVSVISSISLNMHSANIRDSKAIRVQPINPFQ